MCTALIHYLYACKEIIYAFHSSAGVAGYAPDAIRKSYIWNRIANVTSRPHGHVGLDLVNKHLNLDFKGKYFGNGIINQERVIMLSYQCH